MTPGCAGTRRLTHEPTAQGRLASVDDRLSPGLPMVDLSMLSGRMPVHEPGMATAIGLDARECTARVYTNRHRLKESNNEQFAFNSAQSDIFYDRDRQ